MDDNARELITLETLLTEFFTKNISNDRRRDIQTLLETWQQQNACWRKCCDFVVESQNQYVSMFCLTTLETVINKKWMALPVEDRSRLKQLLYHYSLQFSSPATVGKIVKLVVDTARLEWPHFYPDFFTNIMGLLRHEESISLGLLYLLTVSQEFGCPRQDLSVARNAELQRLLLAQTTHVFPVLTELLSSQKVDCCLVLQVVNHLFTWVPADHIPNCLVTIIFQLALDIQNSGRALLALSTLNEILYRHWTPPCWQQFLQFTLAFLQTPWDGADRKYLEKKCDLLQLVLAGHMSRGAENMNELLVATLRLTESQKTVHPGMTSCLHIWNRVLDHPSAYKYADVLFKLAELILHRIQWSKDRELLLSTDDDEDDDIDEEAEKEGDIEESPWQRVLRPCLEIVARVAELKPQPVLHTVVTQWVELCQNCRMLSLESPRSELLLRDLISLTRMVGRLSPTWSEAGPPTIEVVRPIVSQLLTLAQLQYHSMSEVIKHELLSVHCEALATLKACCYWLIYLTESELSDVMAQLTTIIVHHLREGTPRKLQHCASHLFLTLTATVRLPDTWSSSSVRPLYDIPLSHLEQEDGYLVAGALLNCLILPNNKIANCQQRVEHASRFALRLSQPLIDDNVGPTVIVDALRLLNYLVRLYKSEGSKQKKLLCVILKNCVERTLLLFQTYLEDPIVSQEILQFFLTLLECLQTQVGVSFVEGVVQTFLLAYSDERVKTALQREDGGGLQQLLGILDLVAQTPAFSAARLTPLSVQLCLQLTSLIPLETASLTVQEAYYRLVYSIVENKWHYLMKGATESDQRASELVGLLRALASALLLTDINLFRLNLSSIEKLNQRWKLYRTGLFKKELMGEMVSVLLITLLNKTHGLLSDDIALSLCHLISSDPDAFFSLYLPAFLGSVERLDTTQCQSLLSNFPKDMDLPSLTKNIFRLVNDLACYQICNVGQDPRVL